jgi:hypothetical protein
MGTIISSIDWSPILGLLVTLVGGLLTYLANSIKNRNAAATAQSKAEAAALKLAAIGASLLQKAWNDLGPKIQAALVDGSMTADERASIEDSVKAMLKDVTDEATLKEIGDALGLPLPGIIAKIAASLIATWTQAHDPLVTSQSKLTYPVSTEKDLAGPDYQPG